MRRYGNPSRRRKGLARSKRHWCEICKGRPFVERPAVTVDVPGQGQKTFPAVMRCPGLVPPPIVDRQRQAAGEREPGEDLEEDGRG